MIIILDPFKGYIKKNHKMFYSVVVTKSDEIFDDDDTSDTLDIKNILILSSSSSTPYSAKYINGNSLIQPNFLNFFFCIF